MKRTIVLGLAALAVLAGCSKTVVEQPAAPADNDAWVYDETLPVPVAFVAPGLTLTKAEVAGAIEGSVMNGLDIGVFGLATEDGVPAWENGGDAFLINNTKVTTGEDGSVTFDPAVYYPSDNDLNYSFYAYYPHRQTLYTDGAFTVDFSLGYTDVLWAEEHAITFGTDPVYRGFNATYCRYVKQIGRYDLMPALNFQHMLTAFRFVAKSTTELSNIKITKLKVLNINTRATLEVAGPDAGTMTYSQPGERFVYADPAVANSALDVTPTIAGVEVGTLILEPATTVEVEVTLRLDNGTTNTVTASLDGNFVAGHRYALTLTVRSPEEVDLSTSLDPWVDEGGSGETIG